MNLIELIAHYQSVLKDSDRQEARKFLVDAGVDDEIGKAIIACFDDDAQQLGAETMDQQITVQDLIDALQQVKDKRQVVGALVMGAEIGDTFITGVQSEIPDENDPPETIGVCWLSLPGGSSLHE